MICNQCTNIFKLLPSHSGYFSRIPLYKRTMALKVILQKKLYILIFVTSGIILFLLSGKLSLSFLKNAFEDDIVDFTHADNVTGYSYYIVPNIVHYVHFGNKQLSFIEAVSIRSVHLNHKPEKIIMHCDCYSLYGKYWDMVKNISELEVRFMLKPTHIFGRPFSWVHHASDIARIKILMNEGGIYLDSDTYVIKSLNYYRKFEMSIGWPPGEYLGNQVLIAHKNARFLKLWLNSYKYYRRDLWYYNAGELPTKIFLELQRYLVHRVPHDFGVHNLVHLLYGVRSEEWRNYHCIHLLIRHKSYLVPDDYVLEFDEENIKTYNKTFGYMARLALYGTTDLIY